MLSNISDKEKHKFDVALINSGIVHWYMRKIDDTFDSYMNRINDYLEWIGKLPSRRVEYNGMKFVKEFINKHKLTDEFLRTYCHELERDNPRREWRNVIRTKKK